MPSDSETLRSQDRDAHFRRLLSDPNPKLRRDALDDLVVRPDRAALPALLHRLKRETNEFVLSRALTTIGALSRLDPSQAEAVAPCLAHADPRVVANALDALRCMEDRSQTARASVLLDSGEPRVRANAILYLARAQPGFDPAKSLGRMLSSGESRQQASALWAAGELDGELVAGSLRLAATARDPEVIDRLRRLATRLARLGHEEAGRLIDDLDADDVSTETPEALDLQRPDLIKRVWAWLADASIFMLLTVATLLGVVLLSDGGPGGREHGHAVAVLFSNLQLVWLVYSVAFFMRDGLGGGRGLAKRYLGLRVVDLDTRTGCGPIESMVRQATFFLPGLNVAELFWAAFDPDGRRLVDRLLGTMVIDERRQPLRRFEQLLLLVLVVLFAAGVVLVTLSLR